MLLPPPYRAERTPWRLRSLTACCYEIEPSSAMDACKRTRAAKTADNFHCHARRSIGSSRKANISAIRCESSTVRMFDDGELVAEIVPELWLLRGYGSYLDGSRMGR